MIATVIDIADTAAWALRLNMFGAFKSRRGALLYPDNARAAHAIAIELMALEASEPA